MVSNVLGEEHKVSIHFDQQLVRISGMFKRVFHLLAAILLEVAGDELVLYLGSLQEDSSDRLV